MMEWIAAAALLPLLLCVGMWVSAGALAFLGLRRAGGPRTDRDWLDERVDEPADR
ncbi:MAG: hypothetical protein ACRD0U_17600 [Acidimicrobiales bacterium]